MHILIADDSVVVRRSLRKAIDSHGTGTRVDECGDGAAMLKALLSTDYDVVFSDVYMPGMNGIEAVSAAHQEGREFFCVFMSTDMSRDVLDVAEKVGAYEFLPKPFRADDVHQVLRCIERIRTSTSVLVVDDSRTVRRVIERVLHRSRFKLATDEAEDGQGAIEKCRAGKYDIVFLDVHMPGIDGFEALIEIRDLQPDARVVLISGEERQQIMLRAGEIEIDAFLPKPFLPNDVDMVLYRLFDLKAPQLALIKTGAAG
jgi:CheY-like chemotaxis protein